MLNTVVTVVVLVGAVRGAVVNSHVQDVKLEDMSNASTSVSSTIMAGCTYGNCVAFCESIGYITGNCIGNSCICVLPREEQKPIKIEDTYSASTVLAGCTYGNCVAFCESIGYITGNCIGNNCICVLPREEQKPNDSVRLTLTVRSLSVTLSSCDQAKCNQICQLLGFTKGICVGNTCECTRVEEQKKDAVESCNYLQCDQLCRRLGFTGGACVGDRCKCDINLQIQAFMESSPNKVKDCVPLDCYLNCRRHGFPSGTCVNNHCRCDAHHKLEELMESASHHSPRDCVHSRCHRICRRLHYDNGVCVGDRCKCDVLFPVEGAVIPTPLDNNVCSPQKCKDFCSSVGFSRSGSCNGKKCKCEILLKKEDNEIPPID